MYLLSESTGWWRGTAKFAPKEGTMRMPVSEQARRWQHHYSCCMCSTWCRFSECSICQGSARMTDVSLLQEQTTQPCGGGKNSCSQTRVERCGSLGIIRKQRRRSIAVHTPAPLKSMVSLRKHSGWLQLQEWWVYVCHRGLIHYQVRRSLQQDLGQVQESPFPHTLWTHTDSFHRNISFEDKTVEPTDGSSP